MDVEAKITSIQQTLKTTRVKYKINQVVTVQGPDDPETGEPTYTVERTLLSERYEFYPVGIRNELVIDRCRHEASRYGNVIN